MDDEVQRRMGRLVDHHAYSNDPTYHAQVSFVRSMIEAVEMAMEDEGVAAGIRRGVINRLTFGTPHGADAGYPDIKVRLGPDGSPQIQAGVAPNAVVWMAWEVAGLGPACWPCWGESTQVQTGIDCLAGRCHNPGKSRTPPRELLERPPGPPNPPRPANHKPVG